MGAAPEYRDPIFATNPRGNGDKARFGWPSDPGMDAMRSQWMDTAEQKRLDVAIQQRAFETVPFIPLPPPAAWRKSLTGMLKGATPVFWNVAKG